MKLPYKTTDSANAALCIVTGCTLNTSTLIWENKQLYYYNTHLKNDKYHPTSHITSTLLQSIEKNWEKKKTVFNKYVLNHTKTSHETHQIKHSLSLLTWAQGR